MDDEMPKCGCGGGASEILPYGPFERDEDGNKVDLGDFIECKKCGISVYRAAIGWVSIEERHRQLRAAWTRAMSGQAPGMEAIKPWLQHAAYCDHWRAMGPEWDSCSCGLTAALQAAERGKA